MQENMYRTDLACENACAGKKRKENTRKYEKHGISVEETVIPPEEEGEWGRNAGRYITLHCGKIWLLDRKEMSRTARAIAEMLTECLRDALGHLPTPDTGVLVAGLGNRFITADSIGPRTADLVAVTHHARGEDNLLSLLGCMRVCAFSPGVLGQTGLEAADLIAEAARAARADAIVAVDALAARSTARLGTTVQICDAGIRPGSGMGNGRAPITKGAIGVPVIALGVPTVVDSATLVWDALEQAGISSPPRELHRILSDGRSFIVSPKESDVIADAVAELLSGAINRALTPMLL